MVKIYYGTNRKPNRKIAQTISGLNSVRMAWLTCGLVWQR